MRFPQEAIEQLESLIASYRRLRKGEPLPGCDAEIARLEEKLEKRDTVQIWWTDLVQAEMCVLEATSDDALVSRLKAWRARLRDVIGDARFTVYSATAPNITATPPPDPKVLRADLGECIRTVYYFYSAYGVSASSRNRATLSALRTAAVILAVQLVAWLILLLLHDVWPRWAISPYTFHALELLIAASAAGVLGSVVSVQRRVQDPTPDSDPFYRYIQMNGDWVSVAIVSPLLGAIFGMVMYGLLAAKLMLSTLVAFNHGAPERAQDVAIVILLGFLAGFAEQLIPDALNRLAGRALSSVSGVPPAPGATAPPPLAAPVVTKVDPQKDAAAKPVTITGTGFSAPGLAVLFGTMPAELIGAATDTSVSVRCPQGTGTVDVTVKTISGTSTPSAATKFTYT